MRIAVYTITKNESSHIQRWADSAQDADYRLVVDTGSDDSTTSVARKAGCAVAHITIAPWRFDDARNAALALLPADIDLCIALDADEELQPGWREALERLPATVTRPRYKYTWSWNEDGSPGLIYGGDKIHTRNGYRWKHPVHETITPVGVEVQQWCDGLEIHHHPDESKSRGQYLPLLELSVEEDPTDDRNAHYLAREYFYRGDLAQAAREFQRHLALPKAVWPPERAKSMRLLARCLPEQEEIWLLRAAAEDPHRREQWLDLAAYYHRTEQWAQCQAAAARGLTITYRGQDYISEAEAWGYALYDYSAISAFRLGMLELAAEHGSIAVEMEPGNERLQENLKWYVASCSM